MVIVEGLDGVGKTTLVEYLKKSGIKNYHFEYDSQNMNLKNKYLKVIDCKQFNLVLDRSFISEMVYGTVIRKHCKLSTNQYMDLLIEYKKVGAKIIYLTASKKVLLERKKDDTNDLALLNLYYEPLKRKYDEVIGLASRYLEVFSYNTELNDISKIKERVKGLLK